MLLSAYRASFAAVGATVGEYITTPEAHGWSPGNTDLQNTAAFQAAIDDASANAWRSSTGRGVVELVPGKIYTVGVNSNGSSSSNPVNALTARSNVEIRTAGKPTRSSGNQAVIQWHSWAGFGTASIRHRNLLWISNVSNFRCGYVQFHGRKNTMANIQVPDYSAGTNGGLNCISIRQNATNIIIKEVIAQHAATDGLLIGGSGHANCVVEDCSFTRNRRQGCSIGQLGTSAGGFDQFIFRRCLFNQTGDFPGDILGNQPGSGIDIEPDQVGNGVYGLTLDDCDFDDNYGSTTNNGTVTSQNQGSGLKYDCRAASDEIRIVNCRCTNQGTHNGVPQKGIQLALRGDPTWDNWVIENLVLRDNAIDQMRFSGVTGGNGGTLTNITIVNVDTPEILFDAGLKDTGHSVTIWKGNFNPTVITNGVQTVRINNGLPV